MACIAGTPERPLPWIRFRGGEPVELEGRVCDRVQPFTNRRACSSCPAYRGVRWDTSLATGLAPNGDPQGLTPDELARWEAAQEAALIDDDFAPIAAFEERMNGGIGERTLRFIGDVDAAARWADYMRDYRARMGDEQKRREREVSRTRLRAWRVKRKLRRITPTESV